MKYMGIPGYTEVNRGIQRYTWVYQVHRGIQRYIWVYQIILGYTGAHRGYTEGIHRFTVIFSGHYK